MEPIKPIKLWQPLLVVVLFILFMVWTVNVLNTGNPWWFLSATQPTYQPSRIVLHHYGTAVTLRPGDEHYAEISAGLNEALSRFRNKDLISLGLSQETLRRYQEEQFVLEAYYSQPIRFNTPVRMQRVTQLLIPIDGRHANVGYFFMGDNGRWLAGAMQMQNPEPLLRVLRELGYLAADG
jgi:hypothetical protein